MPIILSIVVLSISILFWLEYFHTLNQLSLTYRELTYVGNATEREYYNFPSAVSIDIVSSFMGKNWSGLFELKLGNP